MGGAEGRSAEPIALPRSGTSQMRDFEASPKNLELDSLDGLAKVYIQARIAAGLAQEVLATGFGRDAATDPAL